MRRNEGNVLQVDQLAWKRVEERREVGPHEAGPPRHLGEERAPEHHRRLLATRGQRRPSEDAAAAAETTPRGPAACASGPRRRTRGAHLPTCALPGSRLPRQRQDARTLWHA